MYSISSSVSWLEAHLDPAAMTTLMLSALIVFMAYVIRNRPMRGWRDMFVILFWVACVNGVILTGLFGVAYFSGRG